jgi:hypothetical protein
MMATPNPIRVQKFLGGVNYPASKQDILRTARESGADEEVVDALNAIPDRQYDDPPAISEALAP